VPVVHFYLREGHFTAFPVQVRTAYAAMLLALRGPMNSLLRVLAIGTLAQVLFGYCALARFLSLLHGNRREPLSWPLVWRTFASPPVRGNILQAVPSRALPTTAGSGT